MKPSAFDYHAPGTATDAVALIAELGDEAKFIAGGQSLMPMLNLRLAVFDHLVDLRKLTELRGIERRGDTMWIGAGTTHSTVGRSAELTTAVPLLSRATPLIGHFQIRNRGTLGGSIAHGDGAAEYPAVAMTLDAEIEALSPRGNRTIAASDFFTGMWTTALETDELLTGVSFPTWSGRSGFAIEEFARRTGDFALAGAAIAIRLDAASTLDRCAITLFGVAPTPVRATAVESELLGRSIREIDAEEVGRSALGSLDTVSDDLHGPATYRRRVGATITAQAWRRAVDEATAREEL
ncbi:xanthine dehydrogenase family protein subunit M [Rhodococcus sp. HNM0563]|uniref:FAD binding domain-containing protein n=1 Tax=unclassified Rhodococcus (in: high G+C Gram-positive bacteria) TaxID=192944 RepID=UPI00146F295B|nr:MULTISPECIES: xanthine dehydrogenase family protein subunit M [unclassified Rhodococcus (in: high G+C Gram-positive bacteria)]MCK0090365.1 xanthine dehydrogenase family protein subunit M [Rhodococcus sp. F64268]NLU61573.1 xanthine dehydrogenase family protein subunit M [Rhodococcus sp. HNM0563]